MIITLTSIPPRFRHLRPTLNALLRQRLPAEEVILYIPERYRRFPKWDGSLPDVPPGVSIHRTETDLGPATKVLPAVREFRGREVDILFCDDDIVYDSRWAERFAGMRREHPGACIAEAGRDVPDIHATTRPQARLPRAVEAAWSLRAWLKAVARHRSRPRPLSVTSGYSDVFRGFGGVMVRPAYFREDAFQIPDVLWTVDDYWLSGHLEANRIPIWLNGDTPRHRSHKARYVDALKKFVCNGNDRQAANDACVEYFRATYGIWLPSNHSDGSSPPACNSSQENATA